jgi:putative endonuclease
MWLLKTSSRQRVIPKPRACTSGARDLTSTGRSSVTDMGTATGYSPRMRPPKQFFVYIMSNGPRSASLYTGITGNLSRRVWQHRNHLLPGFTSRYNLTRLIYCEAFADPDTAITREKEIKGWRREKKVRLIQSMNPQWRDLSEGWEGRYKPEPCREIPRPAGKSAGLRDDACWQRDSSLPPRVKSTRYMHRLIHWRNLPSGL